MDSRSFLSPICESQNQVVGTSVAYNLVETNNNCKLESMLCAHSVVRSNWCLRGDLCEARNDIQM